MQAWCNERIRFENRGAERGTTPDIGGYPRSGVFKVSSTHWATTYGNTNTETEGKYLQTFIAVS